MIFNERITSARLHMRPLTTADASDRYLGWLQDPEVTRFLEVRRNPPNSLIDLRTTIKNFEESSNDYLFGIFLREVALHVGNIRLGPIDTLNRRAVIGVMIGDKEYWGKGVASEAISAVVEQTQTRLGISRFDAGCYSSNLNSVRAFQKAGFHVEASLKRYWLDEQTGWQDELVLARIEE